MTRGMGLVICKRKAFACSATSRSFNGAAFLSNAEGRDEPSAGTP